MSKICYIATIPHVIYSFMSRHVNASAKLGKVTVICNPQGQELLADINASFIPLPLRRKISLWFDGISWLELVILFRRERFDLVHSIMPKTGLLGMAAAWLARVPIRLHTFTGQVWVTKTGWKRLILKQFDKLIVLFSTHILVDSESQRAFLVAEGILAEDQGIVIGNGSICGVDASRFHPDEQTRKKIRSEFAIGLEDTIILFLGRLNRDKGMLDLARAFSSIASVRERVSLVLVGAEEDVTYQQIRDICGSYQHRLRYVRFTPYPEHYMAAADIFCLPSYREGFGQVIIESAACGLPSVASRIYGVTDAVLENRTGLLFDPGDVSMLTQCLLRLIDDVRFRHGMGDAARRRAIDQFNCLDNVNNLNNLYKQLLAGLYR